MNRSTTFSRGIYSLFLWLFPDEFRRDYGAETLRVFGDDCRETYAAQGRLGVVQLWLRTVPDLLRGAASEHMSSWLVDHPGPRRSMSQQLLICAGLVLGIVAIFITDVNTPPEVPMAVLYGCVLFAAGALLRPSLALLTCVATLSVYIVDGFVAPGGWAMYHLLGLLPILAGGLWALNAGANHARLSASTTRLRSRPARKALEALLASTSSDLPQLSDEDRIVLRNLLGERAA